MYTYIHTYKQTNIHTYTYTYIYINIYIYICVCVCVGGLCKRQYEYSAQAKYENPYFLPFVVAILFL